jgi:hypothetical protein
MNDENKLSKGTTKTVVDRLVATVERVTRTFCCTMKIIIVGKDRPFFRPEVYELSARIRRWFHRRNAARKP